jgi:NADPH:quinone reductase-like Zn-dependent oxidoreductase
VGAGLNRGDLWQVAGHYPPPPGLGIPEDIPGLEFAGVVEESGPLVERLSPGDKVMGLSGGAAQADEVVVPEGFCLAVPTNIDLADAGAIPEAFVTAHDALVGLADLCAGERVLIHAAGSGVGTAAIQIANALGAEVTGTSRKPEKLKQAAALGMKHGVLIDGEFDVRDLARQLGEFDVVIDLVGGRYFELDMRVVRYRGRIVVLSMIGGSDAAINLRRLMALKVSVLGATLRMRSNADKTSAVQRLGEELAPLLARGDIRPVIDRRFPLEAVQAAYDLLATDSVFGKVLLTA